MTTKEMHIALERTLNKAAANEFTKWGDDEKDNVLNLSQLNFIESVVGKKPKVIAGQPFQNDQLNMDNIRTLVSKNQYLLLKTPSQGTYTDGHLYEPNMSYAILPNDYLYYLNSRANLRYMDSNECEITGTTKICGDIQNQEYVCVLPYIANIAQICTNNVVNFRIDFRGALRADGTYGDLTVFDYAWFTPVRGYKPVTGLKAEDDKFYIINLVLEFLNRFNAASEIVSFEATSPVNPNWTRLPEVESSNRNSYFKVYWETYNDQYYPNSFVFVTNQKVDVSKTGVTTAFQTDAAYNGTGALSTGGIEVALFGAGATAVSNGSFFQQTFCRNVMNGIDWSDSANPLNIGNPVANPSTVKNLMKVLRPIPLDALYTELTNPLVETTLDRPLAGLASNYLFVYDNGKFAPHSIFIDYVRKPRPISLRYAWNCELPAQSHQKVVEMAAAYILEIINPNRYQSKVAENDKTV